MTYIGPLNPVFFAVTSPIKPSTMTSPKPVIPLSPAEVVMKQSCIMFGCTLRELRSATRAHHLVLARRYVAQRLRLPPYSMSLTAIGRRLNRDHTTVINLLGRKSKHRKRTGDTSCQSP